MVAEDRYGYIFNWPYSNADLELHSLRNVGIYRPQEYNRPRFRERDEECVPGIAILLYTDKGVPVAQRPTKLSPSRYFRCGLEYVRQI